jgi:hypothetical protein
MISAPPPERAIEPGRLPRDAAKISATQYAGRALAFATTVVATRLLGPIAYGLATRAISYPPLLWGLGGVAQRARDALTSVLGDRLTATVAGVTLHGSFAHRHYLEALAAGRSDPLMMRLFCAAVRPGTVVRRAPRALHSPRGREGRPGRSRVRLRAGSSECAGDAPQPDADRAFLASDAGRGRGGRGARKARLPSALIGPSSSLGSFTSASSRGFCRKRPTARRGVRLSANFGRSRGRWLGCSDGTSWPCPLSAPRRTSLWRSWDVAAGLRMRVTSDSRRQSSPQLRIWSMR